MQYETILTNVVDGVLTVTMNRPEKLNAWTPRMGIEMADAISAANDDNDVIAIVVTGAGRGFCAGADMSEVFQAQLDGDEEDRTPMDWVGLMRSCKPIVAAVNGPAIGVGLSQVMSMDHIIGAAGAKFSLRFVKVGVVPELGSSNLVPMRVGFGKASELMLTGKTILAEEAAEIGLIDQCVPAEQLLDAAHEMARAMGDNPQASLRFTKQLLTENMSNASLRDVQRLELQLLNQAYETPEHKEAIAAFLEKREPDFKTARER
ncbi:MAG: enoyl-CoA hydratase/isomerase family protein [Acidimicrobiaceae bacterium]|nr:enoyl-CoA hydratase/isomerase family protein [Acidimicrobiaceae bacterium]MDA9241267.1 enoyl-CoA hydratase-related protein [bacterium]MDB4206146.1 enoyl-CoA hydratase-related protein [bacterium]MDC1388239.1 enoyl-CoA hydratase-related protein [Acidimicrobiales bacterium]